MNPSTPQTQGWWVTGSEWGAEAYQRQEEQGQVNDLAEEAMNPIKDETPGLGMTEEERCEGSGYLWRREDWLDIGLPVCCPRCGGLVTLVDEGGFPMTPEHGRLSHCFFFGCKRTPVAFAWNEDVGKTVGFCLIHAQEVTRINRPGGAE